MGNKVNPLNFHFKNVNLYKSNWIQQNYNFGLYTKLNLNKIIELNKSKLLILDTKFTFQKSLEIWIILKHTNLHKREYSEFLNKCNFSFVKLDKYPVFKLVTLDNIYIYPKYILYIMQTQLNLKVHIRKLLKNISNLILNSFKYNNKCIGLKLQVSGTLKTTQQAYTEMYSVGTLTLHTKINKFMYDQTVINTPRGSLGLKLWINYC